MTQTWVDKVEEETYKLAVRGAPTCSHSQDPIHTLF